MCTKLIRTYFKEIIQIETSKLEQMQQLTQIMEPHIDETVTENPTNDDSLVIKDQSNPEDD